LERRATTNGYRLRFHGIGLDTDAAVSVAHLARLGHFDEIAAGGEWLNSAALRYHWGDLAGPAGTPQILVLGRTVVSQRLGNTELPEITSETMLARKLGLTEILIWIQAGAPLPRAGLASAEPDARDPRLPQSVAREQHAAR
jgi:hypothetical protein